MSLRRLLTAVLLIGLAGVVLAVVLRASGKPTDAPVPAVSDPASPAPSTAHQRMLAALLEIQRTGREINPFQGEKLARDLRTARAAQPAGSLQRWGVTAQLGMAELLLGNEREGLALLEEAYAQIPAMRELHLSMDTVNQLYLNLGVGYMRLGETENCCRRHNADSCILPPAGGGIHSDREGSSRAIVHFTEVLQNSSPDSVIHRKAVWLLNLAHMTLGDWPDKVPATWRVPPEKLRGPEGFPRFRNIAAEIGLDTFSLAGGAVGDDFNGDGHLDLMVSTMDINGQTRLFVNRHDGSFVEDTAHAGLEGLFGGLNLIQADYDNDGDVDVLVLRGAWMHQAGRHPKSLLANRGDGTFTDVTFDVGLEKATYPTQTGAWGDYDLDGDLDLYIGNESRGDLVAPGQLYRNDGGHFTDVTESAGVASLTFAKSVSWADYDNDRYPDLFVSNLGQPKRLYHNNRNGTFTDVAPRLGVVEPLASFPAWFMDIENDGDLDLYVSSYTGTSFVGASVANVAAHFLGKPVLPEALPHLYRNDGRGGFAEVTREWNLVQPSLPMASNFGDLDNDGWLDFYLGTGSPDYESLIPNLMYRNDGGKRFQEVTYAGGFGHLQKGHAIVFADFDNDGDQDVFEQMGGAYTGDKYRDAFYENPGFANHWLTIQAVGTSSNRSAIGARIRVETVENGSPRTIYKHVNAGATFGGNPLRQTIGLGRATRIERVEVYWPKTDRTQVVLGIPLDRAVRITEGREGFEEIALTTYRFGKVAPQ